MLLTTIVVSAPDNVIDDFVSASDNLLMTLAVCADNVAYDFDYLYS